MALFARILSRSGCLPTATPFEPEWFDPRTEEAL